MAAPVNIILVNPRVGSNSVDLAVQEDDGDIQDLTQYDGKNIENGSTLRVCSSGWLLQKEVWTRIGTVWSQLAKDLNT